MKNPCLLNALKRQPTTRTPVWLMRQAGRYLPEYRALRKEAGDFLKLAKTPELACEVTLQPLRRFDLDAAIVFSDILTIPDAMGLGLHITEAKGPWFERPVQTEAAIKALRVPDPLQDIAYVDTAIRMLKVELKDKMPLLGFSGSPWTLATYMVEGQSSSNFKVIKSMLYQQPALLQHLLQTLTESVILYLQMQITAGADAVMLFDTWGSALGYDAYQHFSLSFTQQIIRELKISHPNTPFILFTKNASGWIPLIVESGCDAIGVDWTVDISQVRRQFGHKVAVQGNLDPTVLYADPDRIREHVHYLLSSVGSDPGYIFNLGHGILPDVPPEHVQAMIEAVRSY